MLNKTGGLGDSMSISPLKPKKLLADTLSRVTEPTFSLATCQAGADHELAMLQINFSEQILSTILINPEGKGLVITHPEDALFVWKEHEEHQNASVSAQISTTALMSKLMALKIADSPTRHSFLISFQELCNRYDQIADVKLAESFKRTLLQASICTTLHYLTVGTPLMK
jgi:hypothetical protein